MRLLSMVLLFTSFSAMAEDQVNFNYPEPTDIKQIIEDVSAWKGGTILFGRDVSGKIVAAYHKPLAKDVAWQEFLGLLDQLGLSTVEQTPGFLRIVPKRIKRRMLTRENPLSNPKLNLSQDLVSMDYQKPTDIKNVIEDFSEWSQTNVVFGRDVSGKVQILATKKVTQAEGYEIFLAALDQLGLGAILSGKSLKIMPQRRIRKLNN